jgi:hypothetical protein
LDGKVTTFFALYCCLLIPNAKTIAAMKEARRGKLEAVTIDQLLADILAEG